MGPGAASGPDRRGLALAEPSTAGEGEGRQGKTLQLAMERDGESGGATRPGIESEGADGGGEQTAPGLVSEPATVEDPTELGEPRNPLDPWPATLGQEPGVARPATVGQHQDLVLDGEDPKVRAGPWGIDCLGSHHSFGPLGAAVTSAG